MMKIKTREFGRPRLNSTILMILPAAVENKINWSLLADCNMLILSIEANEAKINRTPLAESVDVSILRIFV